MFNFIKYLLLAVFLFVVMNLFLSNLQTSVPIQFKIPLVGEWSSVPIEINYLILVSFCLGIVFAGFLGALRLMDVRGRKKELKILRREMEQERSRYYQNAPSSLPSVSDKSDSLPSIDD